jgi:hypothetical protein
VWHVSKGLNKNLAALAKKVQTLAAGLGQFQTMFGTALQTATSLKKRC